MGPEARGDLGQVTRQVQNCPQNTGQLRPKADILLMCLTLFLHLSHGSRPRNTDLVNVFAHLTNEDWRTLPSPQPQRWPKRTLSQSSLMSGTQMHVMGTTWSLSYTSSLEVRQQNELL